MLGADGRQIARLARDGLSNPEIGSRLFISSLTVKCHFHQVFTQLEIGSRHSLTASDPADTPGSCWRRVADTLT
jgi:ATP/maltotriose-dependent transcriptional regulator MalT